MKYFKCPNCKQETISIFKKANLDPRSYIICKNCDEKIRLPFYARIITLIFTALAIVIVVSDLNIVFKIVFILLVLIINELIDAFLFPLIVKE